MDRNTTLAFTLIGIILIIWLYFNTPTPQPPPKATSKDSSFVVKQDKPLFKDSIAKKTIDSLPLGKYFVASSTQEKIITIENDVAIIELTNKGGKIKKLFLKNYKNWFVNKLSKDAPFYKTNIQLLNDDKGSSFDLAFVTSDGKAVSTSDLDFSLSSNKSYFKLKENDSISLTYSHKVGVNSFINKNFTFYGNRYHTKFDLELIKMNNIISSNIYDLVWGNGLKFVEENSFDEASASNSSVYYGDEQVIVDAPSSGEKIEQDFNGKVDWVTIRNKYFAAIIAPLNSNRVDGAFIRGYSKQFADGGVNEFYSARLKIPFNNSEKVSESFLIYIGPVDYSTLKVYKNNFDKIVDFGSFFGLKVVVRPVAEFVLLPLFNFLHLFINNYGIVIIVFSLIIKILLHPLTKSSMYSMKKMQLLQPKIAEIKEKFKDEQTKISQETMKLYSTYGINPAGGCLPLLLQMPIFIALWGLFQTAIELRQEHFIWWITDLSKPDVILKLGFRLPIFGLDNISGLALLMGITTYIQQAQSVKDPQQKMLVYIMPVMLTIIFMSFPSGLNLYYFMFNVFSLAQQYYINHKHSDMKLEPVKNPSKKKGFMARIMEQAEQQAKSAQKRKK